MERKTYVTGFPRIGKNRELKWALEKFWKGIIPPEELQGVAKALRREHWEMQKKRGISLISCNDFSFYDIMLDTALMLGAYPSRYRAIKDPLERYFTMARGGEGLEALEMTKWFNTNYHYLVPTLEANHPFRANPGKLLQELQEAQELGIPKKLNLIGPVTFLSLCNMEGNQDPLSLLDTLLPIYGSILYRVSLVNKNLVVQMEEPLFARDPSKEQLQALDRAYQYLTGLELELRFVVSTYFDQSTEALEVLEHVPLWGVALDFVQGRENLEALGTIGEKQLFAGVVDGRNIWRNDMEKTLALLDEIAQKVPKEQIWIGTSCSLLHVPYSLENEPDSPYKHWMSFGEEKLEEIYQLSSLFHGPKKLRDQSFALDESRRILQEKEHHPHLNRKEIRQELQSLGPVQRRGEFQERMEMQRTRLKLPLLPSTTIGSFPQTSHLRQVRRKYRENEISREGYEKEIRAYIDQVIAFQEEIGLDVLVHGEPERTDMVEYFGEKLEGFFFTRKGWVQSYGSRCVKPPVIYGDVVRNYPMTLGWTNYAQSKTNKPMKGMLTGPVTILNWSFVRDDLPLREVCRQVALALSQEIDDLQKQGIKIIQVDEAAFKEGYPLRKRKVSAYEGWAVESFQLSVHKAAMDTQIHSHMCYSQFDDIMDSIEAMDTDVITIETSRSGNRLLQVFKDRGYPKDIGPGVYDIHSPRIPSVEEFKTQLLQRLEVIPKDRLWVNPDCGLKTRNWEEVEPALRNMLQALKEIKGEV